MTKPTTRLRTATGFAAILTGILLSMVGLAVAPAGATHVGPVDTADGNPSCKSLGYDFEFKINSQPSDGDYGVSEADSGIVGGGTVTIDNAGSVGGVFYFDWSSDIAWDAVVVKQGSGASLYAYNPPSTGDTELHPSLTNGQPTGAISHVSFCRNDSPPPPVGSLSVDKAVDGNDPQDAALQFTFTVDCLDNGQDVDLNGGDAGTQATFTLTAGQAPHVLSDIPTGATCTVAETNAQGADATSMSVDGGAPTNGTSVSGLVIGDGTTVAVLATNTFNAAPRRPAAVAARSSCPSWSRSWSRLSSR